VLTLTKLAFKPVNIWQMIVHGHTTTELPLRL